jgi:hypothetical protein
MTSEVLPPSLEGFYQIAFTGQAGSGFGMLIFREGLVIGADVTGTLFDGSYDRTDVGTVAFNITMAAPAGVAPVQTGVPLPGPASIPIVGELAADALLRSQPILIQTMLGPVNIAFKRLRGLS